MYGEKPRQIKSLQHYGTRPISNYMSREKITSDTHYIIDDKDMDNYKSNEIRIIRLGKNIYK